MPPLLPARIPPCHIRVNRLAFLTTHARYARDAGNSSAKCRLRCYYYRRWKYHLRPVKEVDDFIVKYKRTDIPDGPIYTIARREIYAISYRNQVKEFFNPSWLALPRYHLLQPNLLFPATQNLQAVDMFYQNQTLE